MAARGTERVAKHWRRFSGIPRLWLGWAARHRDVDETRLSTADPTAKTSHTSTSLYKGRKKKQIDLSRCELRRTMVWSVNLNRTISRWLWMLLFSSCEWKQTRGLSKHSQLSVSSLRRGHANLLSVGYGEMVSVSVITSRLVSNQIDRGGRGLTLTYVSFHCELLWRSWVSVCRRLGHGFQG